MTKIGFRVFISAVCALGLLAGYRLSGFPRVDTYKLLNVVGLFYDFLGVIVLSELALSSAKWKTVSVDIIAPAILWLHTVFPFGVLLGCLGSSLAHRPSAETVFRFALLFWSYSVLPVAVLEQTAVFPRLAILRGVESRWRWFSLYLLLTGVGIQLIAALMGLNS